MEINKYITGDFLNHIDVETGDILTFNDGGEEGKINDREVITFEVSLPDKTIKKATPNKTSLRALATAWGVETQKWVGKQAIVTKNKENVRGEMKWVIYLEPVKGETTKKEDDDIPVIETEDRVNVDEIGF